MALTLRLVNPEGRWFSLNIRRWAEEHPESLKVFDVVDDATIKLKVKRIEVGRDESNQIVLDNPHLFQEVSRKHAIIMRS